MFAWTCGILTRIGYEQISAVILAAKLQAGTDLTQGSVMKFSVLCGCIIGGLSVLPALSLAATAPVVVLPRAHIHQGRLLEPTLRLSIKSEAQPSVALTFDACMGKVDRRILDTLVDNRVPATIFVTARWLKRNAEAFAILQAHPDLFEIEDHGANHVPAVDRVVSIYGIQAAGSPKAVADEVEGGSEAIVKAGAPKPKFFRGATAKYTPSSIQQIEAMGYKVAGYSINGDGGSLLGRLATERNYARAKDGDVIISHINQPTHQAGEGVIAGILDLRKRGFRFVLLRDQEEVLGAAAQR
jgi:peptidoglycan/xylan/chitin deacetylase (PgdA/CDA1 family)